MNEEQTTVENTGQETQPTPNETQGGNEEVKTFNQEEVDKIVSSRLQRERETIAKTLGLETYSKEALEGFTKTIQETTSKIGEYETTLENVTKDYESKLQTTTNELLKHKYSISDERFEDAMALAKTRAEKNGIELDQALHQVVSDFPNMTGKKNKGGIETGNQTTPPDNPLLTENLLKKYPHLKK